MKKKEAKKVGIYGGTFDPIHFGHLNLAIQMQEIHHLDEILFCPVQINPHKKHLSQTPFEQRFEMLKKGIAGVPYCSITDIEAQRSGPSFTIDTLRILMDQPNAANIKYSLIMGDDAIPGFFRWHQPKEIIKLVPLLIGRRLSIPFSLETLTGDMEICETIKRGMTDTRIVDISSTEIRKRIREGLFCRHLVPEKVMDYIYENNLY